MLPHDTFVKLLLHRVVARIVALGWGSELARILCESDKPQNWEKVIKTCQKEVTERGRYFRAILILHQS